MTNGLSIEEVNNLQAENKRLSNELFLASNQYNSLLKQYNQLMNCIKNNEIKFKKILSLAQTCDLPSCLNVDCNCDICHDEVTENGKRCMQKGMREIIKVLNT